MRTGRRQLSIEVTSMNSQQSLAERFREQNRAGRLLLPNAWDAASARIFEDAGFSAVGTTSAGIAYAQGLQDAERISRVSRQRRH